MGIAADPDGASLRPALDLNTLPGKLSEGFNLSLPQAWRILVAAQVTETMSHIQGNATPCPDWLCLPRPNRVGRRGTRPL